MKLPVLLAAAALAICLTGCSHAQTDATPSATSETAGAAATAWKNWSCILKNFWEIPVKFRIMTG